jgi:hypothetical protein
VAAITTFRNTRVMITDAFFARSRTPSFSPYGMADLPNLGIASMAQGTRLLRQRVLELVLQGKRDGHRDFCLSAGVHENDIACNRLGFLARRFRNVVEQLRDFSNAQDGLPHNPSG